MVGTDINLLVAVTDGDWFNVLRRQPDLREVNFWSPSESNFQALKKGELFLFKLHEKDGGMIVGGGVFIYANVLPCSLAWEAFGSGNGASSLTEMQGAIKHYRKTNPNDKNDFKIGCRILTQPFFFEKSDWIPAPKDWSPNIVRFKKYDASSVEGRKLWDVVNDRMSRAGVSNDEQVPLWDESAVVADEQARYGEPYIIRPRLGQGGFRILITDNYQRRCAVTREKTLPVLDAAHIRPYSKGGQHDVRNGLLLRRDIHSLFDRGYVTVTPEHRFEVSRQLDEDYGNGKVYYDLQGKSINLPTKAVQLPDPKALAWHNENLFKG